MDSSECLRQSAVRMDAQTSDNGIDGVDRREHVPVRASKSKWPVRLRGSFKTRRHDPWHLGSLISRARNRDGQTSIDGRGRRATGKTEHAWIDRTRRRAVNAATLGAKVTDRADDR